MSEGTTTTRGSFASNFGFMMAAVGSAVGLGNIWKFPYITGEYGGGAFVLVYLVCITMVGLPLMYAELIIGRRGGSDILGALRKLTQSKGALGTAFSYLTGLMAVLSAFLMLAFYSVVAGWAVYFFLLSVGLIPAVEFGNATVFDELAANARTSAICHTVFMLMTIGVVTLGVHRGIEFLCKTLMPLLFVILTAMLGYVAYTGGLDQSLSFLFRPDFSKLTSSAVLEALGHAFFTLSLGMGAMVTYGSYLKEEGRVIRDSVAIAALDTIVALLAGTVIFAVVFQGDLEPSAGPGLLFQTLPELFVNMPGGRFVACVFFGLVVFAAWSSAISLLEVVVAYFVDEWKWPRFVAAGGIGAGIWALGLACAMGVMMTQDTTLQDGLDDIVSRYMLPIGGLLIAIAAGWLVLPEDGLSGFRHMVKGGAVFGGIWQFLIRFVTPIMVTIVLLWQMGLFDAWLKGETPAPPAEKGELAAPKEPAG
ncbi:MAG: sodium-dependent transporter [Planctomycetota bacterium]|nr:MAG: sodium-dependent transporter [Planctomycetota bacterium]